MIKNTPLGKLFPLWLSVQTELPEVIRWTKHAGDNPKLRTQSTDKHVLSFLIAAKPILLQMSKYAAYDLLLVTTAIEYHDLPEGFLKRDVTLREKKDKEDVDEYVAFLDRHKHLDSHTLEYLEYAYLLQFAFKKPELFPHRARNVIHKILKENKLEATLFRALEGWEYIFYAYEGYIYHKDAFILYDVVESQIKKLQASTRDLPGFRQVVFTEEFEAWCLKVLKTEGHV